MADRPIFIPNARGTALISEVPITFRWHPGMSKTQRQRNVRELHAAAAIRGVHEVLEVSSMSDSDFGRSLSAMNLTIGFGPDQTVLESAYQSSKVFSRGGPFSDLYFSDGREAKKDPRIRDSGRIVAFEFKGESFPSDPPTVFYDWLFFNAVFEKPDLLSGIMNHRAFSDISFNPDRSLNCQARTCAMIVSLQERGVLDDAIESFGAFLEVLSRFRYGQQAVFAAAGSSEAD